MLVTTATIPASYHNKVESQPNTQQIVEKLTQSRHTNLHQSSRSFSTTLGENGTRKERTSGDSTWSNALDLFIKSNPAKNYRQSRANMTMAKKNLTNIDEEGLAEDEQRTNR